MNKAYSRINNGKGWEEYPSDKTPLNKPNLDKADIALDEIDNRVITLDSTKATKIEISELFKDVEFDEGTGIITFTRKNGATITIDTPMEKIQTGIYYNPDTEKLVLPLIDGTSMEVDLSRLMKYDEFLDSDTIAFSVKPNGTVTAIIKEGSIEEKHLRPNYLADIKVESAKAEASVGAAEKKAKEAEGGALMAKSYNSGNTGVRDGENTDNAKYYSEQAKKALESLEQSGAVTGIKGNAESSYRTGNVNITPENIGAPSMEYMNEHFVGDYVSKHHGMISSKGWHRIAQASNAEYGASCVVSIKRGYHSPAPEYQKVQLVDSYKSNKLLPIVSFTGSDGNHLFMKIRKTWDARNSMAYIEIYQRADTNTNSVLVTVEDALCVYGGAWKAITPTLTEETVSGITVQAAIDLPANFAPSHNVMDTDNNNNITLSYHKPGLDSADWLTAWNGYELRAIAPSKITGIGSAVKATQDSGSNVIKDTYLKKSWVFLGEADWRGGTFTHLIPQKSYSEYLMTAYDGTYFNEFSFQVDTLLKSYQAHGDVSSLKIKYDIDGADFISVSFENNSFVFMNQTYNRDVRIYAR